MVTNSSWEASDDGFPPHIKACRSDRDSTKVSRAMIENLLIH